MSLKIRITIILTVIFLVLIGATYVTLHFILNQGVATIEKEETVDDVTRSANLITHDLTSLDTTVRDWAAWDDTYQFEQDHNQDFITTNLSPATFPEIKLNVIMIIDNNNNILFGQAYDIKNKVPQELPPELVALTKNKDSITQFNESTHSQSGLLNTANGILLVDSQPIVKSQGTGPTRGTFIMGRYLDQDMIKDLEASSLLTIEVKALNDPNLGQDFLSAKAQLLSHPNDPYIVPVSNDSITGYELITGFQGAPSDILQITDTRYAYNQGLKTVTYATGIIILIGLTFEAIIIFFLNNEVLSKLAAIMAFIKGIEKRENPRERIPVKGNDEFAKLSHTINDLLDAITTDEAKLKTQQVGLEEHNRELTQINELTLKHKNELEKEEAIIKERNEELEKFNKTMLGRELKMAELKNQIEELKRRLAKG